MVEGLAFIWPSFNLQYIVILSLIGMLSVQEQRQFQVGPVPQWVDPLELPSTESIPKDLLYENLYYLAIDSQRNGTLEVSQSYQEYCYYVEGPAGVQSASQFSIEFDPSYHELVLHSVEVIRDGVTHDRLVPEQVQILQLEKGLEDSLYDGRLTAHLILEDVRVGDVVRYRYSIRGNHPAFPKRYSNSFWLQYSVPVAFNRHIFLWPNEHKVQFKVHEGVSDPLVERLGEHERMTWIVTDAAPMIEESNQTGWHEGRPWVELSEYSTWAEVASWAVELYADEGPLAPSLKQEVARIKTASGSTSEAVQEMVRFVQEEIRYTGIELGLGGYRPTRPSVVYDRRFGDCKDKALLLRTMLAEIGVDSSLGLVSSSEGRGLPERLALPSGFDHVILRIELEGQQIWVDATRAFERGPLGERGAPLYHFALLIEEETTGLVPILLDKPTKPDLTVTKTILAHDPGTTAFMQVKTQASGWQASLIRSHFKRSGLKQVERDYLTFVRNQQESAEQSMPLDFVDDSKTGLVATLESYRVPGFWEPDEELYRSGFGAEELYSYLPLINVDERNTPVQLGRPIWYSYAIHVTLNNEWELEDEHELVENEYFRFAYDREYNGNGSTLRLTYDLQTFADHVPAADAALFRTDINRARELLRYGLQAPKAAGPDSVDQIFPPDVYAESAADSSANQTGEFEDATFGLLLLASFLLPLFGFPVLLIIGYQLLQRRASQSLDERIMGLGNWSPWFTVWMFPRATVRKLITNRCFLWVPVVAILHGAGGAISNLEDSSLLSKIEPGGVLIIAVLLGLLLILFAFYFACGFAWISTRIFRCSPSYGEVCIALSSAWMPAALAALLWIPIIALGGFGVFASDTLALDGDRTNQLLGLALRGTSLGIDIWCGFLVVNCLAEACHSSSWRALAILVIPPFALFMLFIMVALGFMLVA